MRKIKKILSKLNVNSYIKQIRKNKNRVDIIKELKENIFSPFTKVVTYENITEIHTINYVYLIKDNELINILNKVYFTYNDIDIHKICKDSNLELSYEFKNKFFNVGEEKILAIIDSFLIDSNIVKRTRDRIFLSSKTSEYILVIDYHNNIIIDVLNSDKTNISNYSLIIYKDKIRERNIDKNIERKVDIIKKLSPLLYSNNYDINLIKKDISENTTDYTPYFTKDRKVLIVYTEKYIYNISNLVVTSIQTINSRPVETKKHIFSPEGLDDSTKDSQYKISIPINDFYGEFIKAQEYISKLGLSIRVLTKFITENNFRDVYNFIINDILHFGYVIYDDYMKGEMIIRTPRFDYSIDNNVIINIFTNYGEELNECSIYFEDPFRGRTLDKNTILELDIGDKIRDFINRDIINELTINCHAKERFWERISKKHSINDWEQNIKNDIYKNGEVQIGTYYSYTKLIKGSKFMYVINNETIISIWKINDFIQDINDRYYISLIKKQLDT